MSRWLRSRNPPSVRTLPFETPSLSTCRTVPALAASVPSLARVPRVHDAGQRLQSLSLGADGRYPTGAHLVPRWLTQPAVMSSRHARRSPFRPHRLHVSAAAHCVPSRDGRFAPSSRLHQWAIPRPCDPTWPLHAVLDAATFVCESPSLVLAAPSVSSRRGSAGPRQRQSWTMPSRGRAHSVRME